MGNDAVLKNFLLLANFICCLDGRARVAFAGVSNSCIFRIYKPSSQLQYYNSPPPAQNCLFDDGNGVLNEEYLFRHLSSDTKATLATCKIADVSILSVLPQPITKKPS